MTLFCPGPAASRCSNGIFVQSFAQKLEELNAEDQYWVKFNAQNQCILKPSTCNAKPRIFALHRARVQMSTLFSRVRPMTMATAMFQSYLSKLSITRVTKSYLLALYKRKISVSWKMKIQLATCCCNTIPAVSVRVSLLCFLHGIVFGTKTLCIHVFV